MPRTATAKKALRQNVRRRAKNLADAKKMKDAIKAFKKLVSQNKMDEAKKYIATVYKTLDKSAKTNLIKKNKASRLKSRLAKKLASK